MKVLFSIIIIITTLVFLISNLLVYSEYLDENVFSFLNYFIYEGFTNKYIRLTSTFLLISFIIANGNYAFKINPSNKRKETQLIIGLIFGFMMILNVLSTYYISLYKYDLVKGLNLMGNIKAENTQLTASKIYSLTGETIEYFDFNKTKKIYEPTDVDIEIRDNMLLFKDDIHQTPINLTLAFLWMTFSFYLSNLLAARTIKIQHNKHGETNTNS